MMRSITIKMPYIGAKLSVNHYLGRSKTGRLYKNRDTKAWQEQLGWQIKPAHLEDWRLPLAVRCDGVFVDGRSQPDLSNLSKCVLDSLEEASGVNDKNMRWQDGDVTYGTKPFLFITIREAEK